jgi:hypothetical protein
MKLFTLDKGYNVVWEPQTLLLEPFANIFKRDKSTSKARANNELAFVWFYADIKSDYQIHTDPKKRTKQITADIKGLADTWKPDKIVMDAVNFYEKSSTSVTATILKDNMYIANKLSHKMRLAVDADNVDINDISKLLDGVRKMPDVIKALQEAEKAVLKEIRATQNNVGSKEKALFEDTDL